ELLLLPDSALLAICSIQLSSAEMRNGEFRQARRYALEAIVSARRADDAYFESVALNNFGQMERSFCRWDSAESACTESLQISDERGFRYLSDHSRRSLAIVFWKRGRLDAAESMATRCIQDSAAVSAGPSEWYASLLRGMILLHRGDHDGALQLFTRKT